MRDNIKICIGVTHSGMFPWQTVATLLRLKFPENCEKKFHMIGSSLIYEAREAIADYSIQMGSEYLLYLDSDMQFPDDMVLRMIEHLENHPDWGLVTGMAFRKVAPYQPCFYSKVDVCEEEVILETPLKFPDYGVLKIEGCGMACCMIRTSAFKDLPKPWFFPKPVLNEDLSFCLKLKENYVPMYVDTEIDVGHIMSIPVTKEFYRDSYQKWRNTDMKEPLFKKGGNK